MALLTATSGTLAAWTDDEYVSAGAGVMVAGDCTTTTLFQTESAARQLSGSLGGADLDTLAAVQGVRVGNANGTVTVTPGTATQVDPVTYTSALEAGALGMPLLSAAVGLNQPAGNAGAYTQWAQAKASGQAAGAAGLVSDQSGAIDGTGTAAGSTTVPTAASVNLESFVPSSVAAMTLDVGAVASSAAVDGCTLTNGWPTLDPSPTVHRSYGIAGLGLNLSAGLIHTMTASVSGTIDRVSQELAAAATTGSLRAAVKAGVTDLVSQSSDELAVGSVTTEITFGAPNLSAARQLLTTPLTDGVVSIDLVNATISFDLAKLAYGPAGLNGLPANTRVTFDAAAVQNLTQRTSALLEAWGEAISAEIEKALAATSFTMDTTVVLQADDPLLGKIDVAEVSLGYATTVGAFLPQTPPAPLPAPTVSTKVLGLGLPGLEALLEPITAALLAGTGDVVAGALDDVLFGPGALVPVTAAAIQSAAVPVVDAADSALSPLADTLTLTVNVQPDQPGAPVGAGIAGSAVDGQYKVSALRIAAVGSTAEIYLATAAAGPVVFQRGAG
jgi:hypothetical protein